MKKLLLLTLLLGSLSALAAQNYTFTRSTSSGPRGGNTVGPALEFDSSVPSTWTSLQESGISQYEKDRRAILAMQGEFSVSFEFIESFLLDTKKDLDTPYFSQATEFVEVIEDRGDFISLQHILVMFIVQDGQTMGPFVTKHWRQDWQWNATERFVFQGDKNWEMTSNKAALGKWTWSVFQVDDSPRYTGVGEWAHTDSASFFETNTISRPLPRREFSVRSDYKLLMGKETLVVTKGNWYHEQKAFKHVGKLVNGKFNGKLRSREVGQNTYKRIKNFDWSAGKKYWSQTKGYWSDVRAVWREIFSKTSVTLKPKVRGTALHFRHFAQADDPAVQSMSSKERMKLIRKTINEYLK
jgi:hypothetical protein